MAIKDIIVRYVLMIFFGIFLNLFYLVFLPLTVYPVYFLLSLFFSVSISGAILTANSAEIEIINACIAGSAYFLLLVLNLSTPKITFGKRIAVLFFDFSIFLLINILRIFLLSVMLIKDSAFFDITHQIFWYAVSILLVFLIWIATVKIFKIREMAFILDIRQLLHTIRK